MRTFTTELLPAERLLGVTYLGDIDLDDELDTLHVGECVEIHDEGGYLHAGTVVAVEPGRYGRRYRVHLATAAGSRQ